MRGMRYHENEPRKGQRKLHGPSEGADTGAELFIKKGRPWMSKKAVEMGRYYMKVFILKILFTVQIQLCPFVIQLCLFVIQLCPFVFQLCPFVTQLCPFVFQLRPFVIQLCPRRGLGK